MAFLPSEIIKAKRNGETLSAENINNFILGYARGQIPDYQMSALLMAIFFRGMTTDETLSLTKGCFTPVKLLIYLPCPALKWLSPDGELLFIFKYTGDNGHIYVCHRDNGNYGAPEKLLGAINSPSWEGSVSMSTDQKKIFFASERPGGFGGKDLYVATKNEDGSWGNVKNLGDKINTKYDEDAPFISPDSRTLVFSSEGHKSIGDFDLFTSDWNKADSSWSAAKNLGYPINTTDDDLFYVLSADGKRGYFSSARKGGKGDQDLYMIDPAIAAKKTFITIIKGKVTENLVPYETDISVSVEGDSKNYGTYRSNPGAGRGIHLAHGLCCCNRPC